MDYKIWSPLSLLDDELLKNIRLVHVFDIVVGGQKFNQTFVVACSCTGKVYLWGTWLECTLNKPPQTLEWRQHPTVLSTFPKIKTIACGFNHIVALSAEGEVYACGSNTHGQRGIGNCRPGHVVDEHNVLIPLHGQWAGRPVVKIGCGSHFSVAVTDNGGVYTWGCNTNGQLGLNDLSELVPFPTRVACLNHIIIKKIACGPSNVLALNDVGELYVWGKNHKGQLGIKNFIAQRKPVKIDCTTRFIKIGASKHCHTSAALSKNWEVFMWGDANAISYFSPQKTPYSSIHEVFARFATPSLTYKSVKYRPRLQHKSFIQNLRESFNVPELSDLTIVVEGKQIFVHRVILRIQSSYFRSILRECWSSEDQSILSIDQDYDAVFAYLKYLYTEELKSDFELTTKVFQLVHEYDDRVAQSVCEKMLIRQMTEDNCRELYITAKNYSLLELQDRVLYFMLRRGIPVTTNLDKNGGTMQH